MGEHESEVGPDFTFLSSCEEMGNDNKAMDETIREEMVRIYFNLQSRELIKALNIK